MGQNADRFVVIVQGAAQCDRVTGECANGCMPGYHSALCNIGKLATHLSHLTYFFEEYITPHCVI